MIILLRKPDGLFTYTYYHSHDGAYEKPGILFKIKPSGVQL